MKYRLVRLNKFTGRGATIYSVIVDDDTQTLFDWFIAENLGVYPLELKSIRDRLLAIGNKVGAREQFFKLHEGNPGDGVCALYDLPETNLRLYCIRYGNCAIILGGGGYKPKPMRALQESEKLEDENYLLRDLSALISNALRSGNVKWSADGYELLGDLIFYDNHENE